MIGLATYAWSMWRRASLATLVAGLSACSAVPELGPSRSFDLLVVNRSNRDIQINTGTGPDSYAAVLKSCGSLIGHDPDIRIGDALVVDGEVVWAFDHFPPPDMQALLVEVSDDGTSAGLLETLPEGGPPLVVCGSDEWRTRYILRRNLAADAGSRHHRDSMPTPIARL
jgi:hypothetical protein